MLDLIFLEHHSDNQIEDQNLLLYTFHSMAFA